MSKAIISKIMQVASPLEQMSEDYLRILSSSFGEEDFQSFALNLLCSNCF